MMHRLVEAQPLGESVRALQFDHPALDHRRPGQVVVVTDEEGGRGYFALASAPGEPAAIWVRPAGGTSAWLATRRPGDAVGALQAVGEGFAPDPDVRRPWLVLVTGTGLAAVRALVQERLATAPDAPITVVHGARAEPDRPGAGLLDAWQTRGVRVLRTVSGAPRVQIVGADLLRDPNVAVYAAGPRGLLDDADAVRAAHGADPVRRNF
ncbi:MAG: hypothetical protein RLZZ383_1576 [Pseudomonadota bacterium]|jgi:NAD(P)H-flavin reductase